jgi:hypothetical protein
MEGRKRKRMFGDGREEKRWEVSPEVEAAWTPMQESCRILYNLSVSINPRLVTCLRITSSVTWGKIIAHSLQTGLSQAMVKLIIKFRDI